MVGVYYFNCGGGFTHVYVCNTYQIETFTDVKFTECQLHFNNAVLKKENW